jgi:hypothetical protein
MVEFICWNCYGGVGFVFRPYKEINMTDISDDFPDEMISIKSKTRRYDIVDLFIVSFYNFFTFALGLGLGFLMWGLK